jgi:hypothetical protein
LLLLLLLLLLVLHRLAESQNFRLPLLRRRLLRRLAESETLPPIAPPEETAPAPAAPAEPREGRLLLLLLLLLLLRRRRGLLAEEPAPSESRHVNALSTPTTIVFCRCARTGGLLSGLLPSPFSPEVSPHAAVDSLPREPETYYLTRMPMRPKLPADENFFSLFSLFFRFVVCRLCTIKR